MARYKKKRTNERWNTQSRMMGRGLAIALFNAGKKSENSIFPPWKRLMGVKSPQRFFTKPLNANKVLQRGDKAGRYDEVSAEVWGPYLELGRAVVKRNYPITHAEWQRIYKWKAIVDDETDPPLLSEMRDDTKFVNGVQREPEDTLASTCQRWLKDRRARIAALRKEADELEADTLARFED